MEDILTVYSRPIDEKRPLVCLDEFAKQLLKDVTPTLCSRPGSIAKQDYEYIREGFASSFMLALPHLGKREIFTSENGTHNANDFAHAIKYLSDEVLPDAEKIVLVMDNLATHSTTSLYKAFPAEEARRLADRLEIHYTPKHGSWLNMAEIEIGKINRCGFKERVGSISEFKSQIEAYLQRVNKSSTPINWLFKTKDARIKLKSLYPTF